MNAPSMCADKPALSNDLARDLILVEATAIRVETLSEILQILLHSEIATDGRGVDLIASQLETASVRLRERVQALTSAFKFDLADVDVFTQDLEDDAEEDNAS